MVVEIPSWTESLVRPRLRDGEEIAGFEVVENSATSKLAVAFTPERTFVTRKPLVGGGKVYEIASPADLTAEDRIEITCSSCGTAFGVFTDDGVEAVHCVSCGADVQAGPTEEAAPKAVEEPPAEPTGTGPAKPGLDDVPGIGPSYRDRFAKAGVTSVDDLLDADAETLAEETGIPAGTVANLRTLGGLTEVTGVGPSRARELFLLGIPSAEDLADADAADLTSIQGVSETVAEDLIEAARGLTG